MPRQKDGLPSCAVSLEFTSDWQKASHFLGAEEIAGVGTHIPTSFTHPSSSGTVHGPHDVHTFSIALMAAIMRLRMEISSYLTPERNVLADDIIETTECLKPGGLKTLFNNKQDV
jgi:hypothetical protein